MTAPGTQAGDGLSEAQRLLLEKLTRPDHDRESPAFPLSTAQRRLWLLHALAPDSSAYNVPVAVRLRGKLDVTVLQRAFDELTAHHEVLRSTFPAVEGNPRQRIRASLNFPLDVRQGTPPTVLDDLRAEVRRPFDLAAGPIARAVLWRLGDADHVLMIVLHHIASDAWSISILLRDLAACYRVLRQGDQPQLRPIAVQPADFAAWEASRAESGEFAAGLDFWRAQLADRGPAISLRQDMEPTGISGPSVTLRRGLGPGLAASLRAATRLGGTGPGTEFTVLLTALIATLSQVTGQRDMVIGIPVSGRDHRDLADVVGYFVNTVPVRFRWDDPGITGAGLLSLVGSAISAALAHQDVPLEMIVEAVETRRRSNRNPLFDVLFTVQDVPHLADAFDDVDGETIELDPTETKLDLGCVAKRDGDALLIQWNYRSDAVGSQTVTGLAQAYEAALRSLLEDPARPLPAPSGLPAVERRAATEAPAGLASPAEVPVSEVERSVAQVWAELLGVDADRIGRHDDFFVLGGQSFLAARAAARLTRRLGRGVEIRDLFEHPTVADLARALDAGESELSDTAPQPIEPVPGTVTTGPLSYPQEQLFILTQLTPESSAYNIPLIARVRGGLDAGVMHAALRHLVGRHEALRTRFELRDGEPVQRVLSADQADPAWTERDLRGDLAAEVTKLAAEDAYRPFDVLGGAPLVRMTVFRVAGDEHVVSLTVHHLIADGWAVRALLRELCVAYAALRLGQRPQLPPPALRYLDYAVWQRGRGRLAAGLEHWRSALAGAPQALELPARSGARTTGRGESVPVTVGERATSALSALAAGTGCTRFMILSAAFAVVLAAYSGQCEVMIGTPAANRSDPVLESLVGMLVNPVVLRADLRGDPTVAALLSRIRAVCLDAFTHQDTPFEKIVETVGAHASHARSPLFQVMLALNETAGRVVNLPGLDVSPVYPDNPTAKYEVLLNLADDGEKVTGVCEYDAGRYERPLIEAMVRHFTRTLELFATGLDRHISALDVVDPGERADLLERVNGAAAHYDPYVPLHRLVQRATSATPDAVAVIGADGSQLSYYRLDRAANAVAASLSRHVGPGQPAGVCAVRSPELVVGEYAALKAGAAILPLDPAWPRARLEAVLRDAGCRAVLADPAGAAALPSGVPVVPITTAGSAAAQVDVPVRPGDLAYIVYTSGSTGRPKGVQVEHAAIANNLLWMQQDWPLAGADRMLVRTAATFDVAVKEIFWPLLAGAAAVLAPAGTERDPAALLGLLDSRRITICHLVPSLLQLCLETVEQTGQILGPHLRYLMCGAEELPAATRGLAATLSPATLLHMYGPTETTVAVTGWAGRPSERVDGRVPLGRAMPNCRLYVLDDDLNPSPALVWGQLYVSGLPLARGYLGRAAETAAAFVPDPFAGRPGCRMYATGDLVRHGPHGLLEFRGRTDRQVKLRGFRVEPGEVEAALCAHPAVRQAAAVRSAGEPSLGAFVVLAEPSVTGEELRRHAAGLLPDYMVPVAVVPLDALPLNASGKVDRKALAARALPRTPGQAFREPSDDTERAVAAIWSEVLGIEPIGADDDFFALGGHSLQAARIVNRLREAFQRDVPVRDMFAEPTVSALARLLRAPQASSTLPTIPHRGVPRSRRAL